MTTLEAIIAMFMGYRIRYRHFQSNEYLYMETSSDKKKLIILTEDGYDFTRPFFNQIDVVWEIIPNEQEVSGLKMNVDTTNQITWENNKFVPELIMKGNEVIEIPVD